MFSVAKIKMEIEFDKEIDAILRKARGGEAVVSFDSHLDADEIAAFAENALPERLKQNFTVHFADCTRCRKILSNVIALNSEAELETASSDVPAKIVEAATPWYRKLFAFPQLAYTMGGLVLVFGGFLGFLALKNLTNSSSSDVSFSTDKSAQMEKSAPQSAPMMSNSNAAATTNSAANLPMTNSAKPMNSTANSATLSQPNSTASTERKSDAPELSKSAPVQPTIAPQQTPADNKSFESEKDLVKLQDKNEVKKPSPSVTMSEESKTDAKKLENLPLNGRRTKDLEDSDNYAGQSNADSITPQPAPKTERSAPMALKKKSSEAGATRSVRGKTFNNVGGIWFDSAYGKQKQKTVTRGTNDYQKLDSGLRSIADSLGGTVVIVWNGKAYRIQ